MLLAPSGSWGRFRGAGFGDDGDSGSEGGEDDDETVPSPSPQKAKQGWAALQDGEDEETFQELEKIRRAAFEACLAEVVRHLENFLARRPLASFEDWISDLHPDNLQVDRITGETVIDHRFYAKQGEHRKLWNRRVPIVRQVQARSPDCSPATSSQGSSGALTPMLSRTVPSPPVSSGSVRLPPFRGSAEQAGEQPKAGGTPTAVQTATGQVPVSSQIQWVLVQTHFTFGAVAPQRQPVQRPQQQTCVNGTPYRRARHSTAAGDGQQATAPSSSQALRWHSPPRQAFSPAPALRSALPRQAGKSVSPLRTSGLAPTCYDSPLRTAPLCRRAESPVHSGPLPSRAESPFHICLKRGSSTMVHAPIRGLAQVAADRLQSEQRAAGARGQAARTTGSFVWTAAPPSSRSATMATPPQPARAARC